MPTLIDFTPPQRAAAPPAALARAARAAADFCRNPYSPKVHGLLAQNEYGKSILGDSPGAVSWCALGRMQYELARETHAQPIADDDWTASNSLHDIWTALGSQRSQQIANLFNSSRYHEAADILEAFANQIDPQNQPIWAPPITQPITQPAPLEEPPSRPAPEPQPDPIHAELARERELVPA